MLASALCDPCAQLSELEAKGKVLPASSGDYKVVQRIADRVIKAVEVGRGGGFQDHVSKCALPEPQLLQGVVSARVPVRTEQSALRWESRLCVQARGSACHCTPKARGCSVSCCKAQLCWASAQHGQRLRKRWCEVSKSSGLAARRFDWEVVVVEDKTPNAFVLPGGKIVVFTGMHLGPRLLLCSACVQHSRPA